MPKPSFVQITGFHSSSCGYCKADEDSSKTYGVWAHQLKCQDYQDLIDRGWRRSGKYLYKPILSETCCPQYTIRLEALDYHPNKSHKKVVKRFAKFLRGDWLPPRLKEGVEPMEEEANLESISETKNGTFQMMNKLQESIKADVAVNLDSVGQKRRHSAEPLEPLKRSRVLEDANDWKSVIHDAENGISLTKPGGEHKFTVKVVRASLEDETFDLYCRYQAKVHGDDPSELSKGRYNNFLVSSPLIPEDCGVQGFPGYGCFHFKWYLDEKLIAVEVMDILPKCLSSVYFMYDPDYSFLSLGTYSALRSIAHVQQLHQLQSSIQYYYLGYYIHSCVKMRYKGQYSPSFLLDPVDYSWHSLSTCTPKLEQAKYSIFSTDAQSETITEADLQQLLIFEDGALIPYYNLDSSFKKEFKTYANMVGKGLIRKMLVLPE